MRLRVDAARDGDADEIHGAESLGHVGVEAEHDGPDQVVRTWLPADNRGVIYPKDLRSRLDAIYGSRLRGLYLFGSRVRGDADEESDMDVLVVLDRIEEYVGEIERTGEVFAELSLALGVSLSRVFVTEAAWRSSTSNFLSNVRAEAVLV